MSVGGIVVDVYDDGPVTRITVYDHGDRTQVRTSKGVNVQFGDIIWWQGQTIYWSDAAGTFEDKKLVKIANSARPKGEFVAYLTRQTDGDKNMSKYSFELRLKDSEIRKLNKKSYKEVMQWLRSCRRDIEKRIDWGKLRQDIIRTTVFGASKT
jgi:hypothetical protein